MSATIDMTRVSTHRQRRHPRAQLPAVLVALPFLLLAMTGSGQTSGPTASVSTFKTLSDGTIVVPSSDKSGKRSEPMILMPLPVQARSTTITTSNAPVTALAIPASTNGSSSVASAKSKYQYQYPFEEGVLALQVALARQGMSSGSFDGMAGPQTRAAIRAFQQKAGLPLTGFADAQTRLQLGLDQEGLIFTNYVVSAEDLASLQTLGQNWLAKSQQDSLAYETILELVAEKSFSNPKLLRWLNPNIVWTNVSAGTTLKTVWGSLPAVDEKAAFVRIFLGERKLQAYGAATNLLVHFPCSIAARVDKRPLGEELHIAAIAPNPNYTFDPAVFPESEEARQLGRKLILQPGPNNPVGTVWLSLDKPGYGIHGTPRPEEIGRTESHGCFRLANWNVEYLLKLVALGTPVFVEP